MPRSAFLGLLLLFPWSLLKGQSGTPIPAGPFVMEEVINVGLSQARIMQAIDSLWPYTFGQEPGALLKHMDPGTGAVHGSARLNYRSRVLMAREETMGTVAYQINLQVTNGQCKVVLSGFQHSGNRSAVTGGIHLGPIYRGDRPKERVPGVGINPANTIHTDIREQCRERLTTVLRGFATRMRQVQER